jgi:nucleotide sugar dehydrogenase
MSVRDQLLRGERGVAVWGAGFVGGTTAMAFAAEGVPVVLTDVNPDAVGEINRGRLPVTNLEYWFGATMAEFVSQGLVRATTDWRELADPSLAAHFVAVPTEREGRPWLGALEDVLGKLKTIRPGLVVVESTLVPGALDALDLGDLPVGVAPRRDWFHSPDKNLKNLPRVYAGSTPEIGETMRQVLSIVCDRLLRASSRRVAELVKCVENSLLHVPAVLATQLARAYPDLDVGEVLDLAATHWRIPRYYPSLGTGGYCIPVSSKYVKLGATEPQHLTILDAAIESDASEPYTVVRRLLERGCRRFGVMGVSYKGDLKVHVLSPSVAIQKFLAARPDVDLRAHDPYYTREEIQRLTTAGWMELPDGLRDREAVIVVTDHKAYARMPLAVLLDALKPDATIIDNYGIWKKYREPLRASGRRYFKIGDPGWTLTDAPVEVSRG